MSYINDRRGKTYTYFLYTLQMSGQSITSGSKVGAGLIEENKNNKDGFYRDFKSRTLFPKFRRWTYLGSMAGHPWLRNAALDNQ